MSTNSITSLNTLLNQAKTTAKSEQATSGGTSFAQSMAISLASFEAQTLGSLAGSALGGSSQGSGTDSVGSLLSMLKGSGAAASSGVDASGALGALSPTGRNTSLFDPESAYSMMSLINQTGVNYKAQYSELSEMRSYLGGLQKQGESLAGIGTDSSDAGITAQVQSFVSDYNAWVKRFDDDMAQGGMLAGTQAAQVSRYELEQDVKSIFNGASEGMRGLRDLGISIDEQTGLASIDSAKFNATLAGNRSGAVATLQQFGSNLADSASLLVSDGNFISNRLNNLGKAIDYIDSNTTSLQAEFGSGDPAQATGAVAQALAAYERSRATSGKSAA